MYYKEPSGAKIAELMPQEASPQVEEILQFYEMLHFTELNNLCIAYSQTVPRH